MPLSTNQFWTIIFGVYSLSVNRSDRTYSLTETESGTVWADALPLGFLTVTHRETGVTSRHAFGELKSVSLSEKSGATGKRILFGLDAPGGIPVDVYLTCTEREIQLTVEASRDTKTHRVESVELLPDLCSVRDDGGSYLVIPHREGAILFAKDAPNEPVSLPVWNADAGLTMPFVGAVRSALSRQAFLPPAGGERGSSALVLLTDSAYATAVLTSETRPFSPRGGEKGLPGEGGATLDLRYDRDPERRRLDVRIVLIPSGDPVSIARAYRDKIIGDGGHVTLRRKMRERPGIEQLLGTVSLPAWDTRASDFPATLRWSEREEIASLFPATGTLPVAQSFEHSTPLSACGETETPQANRWREMEQRTDAIRAAQTKFLTMALQGGCDWSAAFSALWRCTDDNCNIADKDSGAFFRRLHRVPLAQVVYHDAVISTHDLSWGGRNHFHRALLYLAAPDYATHDTNADALQHCAVLCAFQKRCTGAFLVAHRFLTPDFTVEEARYSDGTRVVINQSETDHYETDDLHLPPLGFIALHRAVEAHHARRVGTRTFEVPAWRVHQSRDGRPLTESGDVWEQTFPLQPVCASARAPMSDR